MFIGNANILGRRTDGSIVYLLDTYTAAAAYSLRQLKTGVTNVVRVRRSSDNAESDFTATEITDGTLTTWTGANNGFVVTWYDQSGNANNATQSTAGSQPQIVSSGTVLTKGSLPAITFDGSNDYLYKNSGVINTTSISTFGVSSGTASASGTLFGSSDTATSLNGGIVVSIDARTTPNRNMFIRNNSGTLYFADLSTARNDANQRLLTSFIDSSKNMSAFDNGATGGTDTYTGTTLSDAVVVGAQYVSGFTSYLNGTIQELILFNTDESANRTDIESDINGHYSIY